MTAHLVASFDLTWLTAVVLLAVRLGALFLMTPVLSVIGLPPLIRVVLVFGLAAVLATALPSASALPSSGLTPGTFVEAVFAEFALGVTMALGVLLAFAMFTVAGRLLDVQIGFGMAQLLDPLTRQQLPILSGLFNQLALVAFFAANGHHTLLRGLAASLDRFPLGQTWALSGAVSPILDQVAGLFTLGFALAAPVVFCLLLVELGLGVVARNLPQMNMFAMGLPVKVLVGLGALSLWLAGASGAVGRIYGSIFEGWEAWFSHG